MALFEFKSTPIPKVVIGINQVDNLGKWDERLNLPEEETFRIIEKRVNSVIKILSSGSHSVVKEQIEHYSALRAYRMYEMLAKITQNCKEGIIIPSNPVRPWDERFGMDERIVKIYKEEDAKISQQLEGQGINAVLNKIMSKLSESEQKKLLERWNKKKQEPVKIGILGKAGVGKTTTVNSLFNANFKTSRTSVGTICAQYKDYILPDGGQITIIDMPGYGRSMEEDEGYKQIYLNELPKCDIVILVIQANSRDFEDDQIMIESLYEWSKEGRI